MCNIIKLGENLQTLARAGRAKNHTTQLGKHTHSCKGMHAQVRTHAQALMHARIGALTQACTQPRIRMC